MLGYNLIAVLDESGEMMLMCKRRKNPYQGLLNLVGGKIDAQEKHLDAAYRELQEETGIQRSDIVLHHLMDFTYHLDACYVEVYLGQLTKPVEVFGDENELMWMPLHLDFFSMKEFAGEGNIGHMVEHIKMYQEKREKQDG